MINTNRREVVRYKDGLSLRTFNRRMSVIEKSDGSLMLSIVRGFKEGEYNDKIKDTPNQFVFRKAGKKLLVSKTIFTKEGLGDVSELLMYYFNEGSITYTWDSNQGENNERSVATEV